MIVVGYGRSFYGGANGGGGRQLSRLLPYSSKGHTPDLVKSVTAAAFQRTVPLLSYAVTLSSTRFRPGTGITFETTKLMHIFLMVHVSLTAEVAHKYLCKVVHHARFRSRLPTETFHVSSYILPCYASNSNRLSSE